MNPQDPQQFNPPQNPQPAEPPQPQPDSTAQQPPVPPQPQVFGPALPQASQPTFTNQQLQYAPSSQPVMPQQSYPQPMAPIGTNQTKTKKKLIFGLVGGAIGLAIIGLIIFLVGLASGVTREDYMKLSDDLNATSSAYNKMGSVYIGAFSTEAEISNGLNTLKSSRSEFDTKLAEVGGLKAIKRDKTLKEQYEAIITKKEKFDKATDAAIEAYEKIIPAVRAVNDLDTGRDSNLVTNITGVKQKIQDIGELKDANNQTLVNTLTSNLTKLETLAVKVQEGRNDFRKYDSKANSEFFDTITAFSNAFRDWGSNLEKMADEGELRDELNTLSSATSQKLLSD